MMTDNNQMLISGIDNFRYESLKNGLMSLSQGVDHNLMDKEKLEEVINPQAAFLGPNIWDHACDDVNVTSVLDDLFNFDELSSKASESLAQEKSSPKTSNEQEAEEEEEEKPKKRKRGRKPGPNAKPKKPKVKEVVLPGVDIDPKVSICQDDLKPQPIIRKSEKKAIPREDKDLKYWKRRIKNNEAAKRSREARRAKENQIVIRAAYLEEECDLLRHELGLLQAENKELMSRLAKLEK